MEKNKAGIIALCLALAGGVFAFATGAVPALLFLSIPILIASLVVSIIALTRKGKGKASGVIALVLSVVFGVVGPIMFVGSFIGSLAEGSTSMENSEVLVEGGTDGEEAEPQRNERGNLAKQIGEEAFIFGSTGEKEISFKVLEAVRSPECQPSASTQNGELVALKIEMTTTEDYLLQTKYVDTVRLDWRDWTGVSLDGSTIENSALGLTTCLPMTEIFPLDVPQGETVTGWWILDLAPGATSVVWSPDGEPGWEWPVP
ncbi:MULTISPECIES: hypothetical protein [unclassified Leucobacter]|uniref:hypothetical protein n=1 Tax=unclassified Leucobacter TaxID=2621730 RepID=UPI00165D94BC|nr:MULTISPECIES: hypothetical protein [unclassified Leucobacter]MBC9935500.1 hypothetical protein [Leucobacter sp. cx-87]